MLGTIGMMLLGMVLWQAKEPPDISGEWTSDEWGTVVLEAKGPGEYEGTFTGSGKDKLVTDGFRGEDVVAIFRGEKALVEKMVVGLRESGKLQVKWSRLEHRFNGTWSKGENRCGTISLRLVDKGIHGGFTTDEDVQLETGTPRVGDLVWKRSQNAAERSLTEKQHSQPSGFDDQSSKTATPNQLQGVWDYISVETDGVVTEYPPASSQMLTITGDLWKMNNSMGSPNRVEIDGRNLTLHGMTSQGPSSGVGGDVPSICYGIYSLEGDTLALCITAFEAAVGTTPPGMGGPYIQRPQTFETKGTKNLVYRLRRAGTKGSTSEKPLDRKNARAVVEAFVAAGIAGRFEQATSLVDQSDILAEDRPGLPNAFELFFRQFDVQSLTIKSVYVNDLAKPMTALAVSEVVKFATSRPDGQREGFYMLTLTMSEEGWLITDNELESAEGAARELRKFLEANPNSVESPPQAASEHEKSATDAAASTFVNAAAEQN